MPALAILFKRKKTDAPKGASVFICIKNYLIKEQFATTVANTMETIDSSLIRMLIAGPEVSLNGSPTVSPTTAALWLSEPLPPR